MDNKNKLTTTDGSTEKMESKNARHHWLCWWGITTLLPFAVTFFLSWYFSSPGGYQPYSQIKLFLLFMQIGFITAYFLHYRLMKAVCSLWGTVAFLFLLSLVVPYLSIQADVTMDMTDMSGEFGTPLYLFISCLTAAWLLPGRWRLIARGLCVTLIIFYILIQFTYIGYYSVTKALLSVNMMLALAQTNLSEAISYINVNLPYAALAAAIFVLLVVSFLVFWSSRFTFQDKTPGFSKRWIFLLVLFLVNCGLSILSISGTRIAHVYAEAYETLKSFGEYQQILENRRNMHIKDPEILRKLRNAPDGVYILVIGESLTRDHMNVYGYGRETTPFQSAVFKDPEYTFFNHVYSCYTQTVQVLTCALTEKNQYNGMRLAEAYSLVDLAREAGFKTIWISNQSRFGVWDTPIGAIGSECDDQYWNNQYIGTDVVTKDYDTALIPYLKKVDPQNRRQLIVIHLMGSHISYWDRYPEKFYHWPEDVTKDRSTEEVMTDEYDNSVLFNDYVMESIMNTAVNYLQADGVVYFSDHGEEVTARPGHNADQFNFTMVRIPFWIYTSEEYREKNPHLMKFIYARRNMPFSNDMLYDTLMGIMGLTADHYDSTCDMFSPAFDKELSTLMTMYGNIMIQNDTEQVGADKSAKDEVWNNKRINNGSVYFNWEDYEPIKFKYGKSVLVENSGLNKKS